MTRRIGERDSIISGIGQSEVGRRLGRTPMSLTVEACLDAVSDAGLEMRDIDGLASYPGGAMDGLTPGFAGPGTDAVQDALRLDLNWHSAGPEGPAQIQAVINAAVAVSAGLARHVLVYRTVWESTAQGSGGRQGIGGSGGGSRQQPRLGGTLQYLLPFGAVSAVNWLAMNATRHFHTYGTTRETLGTIAINTRRNAGLNPKAIFRDPLTMDEYLDARIISTPLCLFDCDVPVDGSTAFVVSHRDHAPHVPTTAVGINAVGTALHGRPSWDQRPKMEESPLRAAADTMWARTELSCADVDTAQLYDGFSIITLMAIEALGFCAVGEAKDYLQGGHRIALEGELPLNTAGGQLSAGRLHGFGLLHEACVQLRGHAGERQVQGDPEVAVVANGGGPVAGTMLVTRGVG